MFRLKFYAALFAVIIGLSAVFNQTAHGQTIVNPSFETDNVPPAPGYGTITGWTGGSGINAANGPFTDNGVIPDGQKAAFLSGAGGAMRQTVPGFTVGASYRLRYYENARNCCAPRSANLQVTAGGVTVVAAHEVVAVGASNPYVLKVSEPFTATAEALEIAFITSGTGDYTVLLDRIEIGRNLIVTNTNDSGAGSLRQTIADAPAGSFISFSETLGDTISLGSVIETNKNLTIVGPGAEALTLRGGGIQPRSIDNGQFDTLAISGLTIADGIGLYSFGSGFIGGAINVILTDSIVRGNRGSGIFCGLQVNMTIARSLISENEGLYGGGIHNEGTVTINDSIISGNTGIRGGGGIYNFNEFPGRFTARVTVNNSSITGNVGGTGGVYIGSGGIYNGQGEVILTNSTVSGNLAKQFYVCPGCINEGAGIRGFVLLINSTVTDNIAGLSGTGGFFTARNSILASVNSTLNSQGYNLISNLNTSITGDTTGNILNTDARLGPLGYYGGRTPTRPLLSGSPAINAGNTATSPALDQRGAARIGAADIGAFELNNSGNGGNFVVRLPDAFTGTAFSYQLNEITFENRLGGSFNYSLGGAPSGVSLIDEDKHVSLAGRTGQTGVYNFSVTGTDGTNSVVTNYSIRVLDSGLPPLPGGCRSNPIVTNKLNAGEGSLRQAIYDVCPGGTIGFSAAPGTIHLTGGRLLINKNLTIEGPGAGALTIRNAGGRGGNGIFRVESGVSAVIAGLTAGDGYARGITNSGTLTLTNMTVSGNVKGGIENLGTLTVASSIISGNGSDPTGYDFRVPYTSDILGAGGINSFGSGSLTVTDSTIADNYGRESGGIYTGSMTMTNSTIRNNRLFGNAGGGGITFAEQDLNSTVTNSTISGNIGGSDDEGSGGIKLKRGTLRLINSTVAYNRKYGEYPNGAGINIDYLATFITRNSIIAGNLGFGDILGTLTSEGYNLIGFSLEMIDGDTTGNIVGTLENPVDARLAALAFNGGPTETHALLADSQAINAGNTATSPATDQRGYARNGRADIGAFEFDGSPPTPTPTPTPTVTPTPTITPTPTPTPTVTPTPTITPTPTPSPTPNTPPNAAGDAYSMDEDATITVPAPGVLGNDTDAQNDALTAQLQTSPANAASFTLNANGSFSYTPNANFNGTDSFTYTASDGSLSSNAATVTITVNAVNDAPTITAAVGLTRQQAAGASNSTIAAVGDIEDAATALSVTVNNSSSAITSGVTISNVAVNAAGNVTADVAANCGAANASFTLKVTDSGSLMATAVLSVAVTSETTPPVITLNGANPLTVNALSTFTDPGATANDNCVGTVAVTTTGTVNVNVAGSYTITYTATDGVNIATATRTVIVADTTPPVITPTVTGTSGNNGWYRSDVQVSWTVTDAESTVSNQTGCQTQTVTADTDGITFTCSATSGGGTTIERITVKRDTANPTISFVSRNPAANANGWNNTDVIVIWSCSDGTSGAVDSNVSRTVATEGANQSAVGTCTDRAGNSASNTQTGINIDKTAPSISYVSRTAANANGWNNTNVTVNWSCSDALSGATSVSVSQILSNEGLNQSATGTCTDKAGNTASNTQTGINIDKTAPTLAPTVSPNPVLLNGTATAAANATDNLSGIASQNCGLVNTSSVGFQTVACTATDLAGNTANVNANYQVAYNFAGFFQPIENLPMINVVNAGQVIAFKFSLSGYQGLNIVADGYPISTPIACEASEPGSTIEPTVNPGGNSLSYDSTTDQYSYVWKTDKKWKGTCRIFVIKFTDGSEYYAKFRFK